MLSSTHSAAQPLPGGPSRAARLCTRAKGRIQTVGNYRRDDDEAEGGAPAQLATNNLDTWTGGQLARPAGVRTSRASQALAMAVTVETPDR